VYKDNLQSRYVINFLSITKTTLNKNIKKDILDFVIGITRMW